MLIRAMGSIWTATSTFALMLEAQSAATAFPPFTPDSSRLRREELVAPVQWRPWRDEAAIISPFGEPPGQR